MASSPARALILTCGVIIGLLDLVALLPGNPDVTSVRGLLVVIAIQALVVWRLLHHSLIAWSLSVLWSISYAAIPVLAGMTSEATLLVSCGLALVFLAILFTPPVLAYVWREEFLPSH